jgi:RNA polymerase sigma-70 factor (ECF subfamily)
MGSLADEFERVAIPHTRSLLRFALRLTRNSSAAEDLVQESLLSAWRSFAQFETGTNARAWLFRILINAFHAQHRKQQSTLPTLILTPDLRSASPSPLESLSVLQALDQLVAEQRTVLLLALGEGFTCREIANILAIPIGTVMSRLGRARAAMCRALSPEGIPKRAEKVAP